MLISHCCEVSCIYLFIYSPIVDSGFDLSPRRRHLDEPSRFGVFCALVFLQFSLTVSMLTA